MLSSIGNRIVAHARLLVNSVNIALNRITIKMIVISDCPMINLRKVAIVEDKSDALNYNNTFRKKRKENVDYLNLL